MDDHLEKTHLSARVALEFVESEGESAMLDADFRFNPADPYAVTAIFHSTGPVVTWTFGRDLLIDGIYEPTGDGDVHVWPCLDRNGSAVVVLELCAPEGHVLVQTPSRPLTEFVAQMLDIVPRGAESDWVDMTAALTALLA